MLEFQAAFFRFLQTFLSWWLCPCTENWSSMDLVWSVVVWSDCTTCQSPLCVNRTWSWWKVEALVTSQKQRGVSLPELHSVSSTSCPSSSIRSNWMFSDSNHIFIASVSHLQTWESLHPVSATETRLASNRHLLSDFVARMKKTCFNKKSALFCSLSLKQSGLWPFYLQSDRSFSLVMCWVKPTWDQTLRKHLNEENLHGCH